MSHYVISISPDEVGHEYRVLLRGPGIDSDGHRYIFATTHRCAAFAEAVNFAYEQGLREPTLRTAFKLAEVLGVPVEEFKNGVAAEESALEEAKPKGKLVFWGHDNHPIDNAVPGFKERYPDTEFDSQHIGEWLTKFKASLASGNEGGVLHQLPAGSSYTTGIPVSASGRYSVVSRLRCSVGTVKPVSTMPSGSKMRSRRTDSGSCPHARASSTPSTWDDVL